MHRTKWVIIFVLLSCVVSFYFPSFSLAAEKKDQTAARPAKIKVVEGLVEQITNDSIVVRGRRFLIAGVPLLNSSGEHVSKDVLQAGKKVEIFFENNSLTSVLVFEYIAE